MERTTLRHVTLNTGRLAVQDQGLVQSATLQVMRPRVARLLNRKPSSQIHWLRLPISFFPLQLGGARNFYGPLFFVQRAGEQEFLGSFAVGTNGKADARLWEFIHTLGRDEMPQHPVTHPLYRPRAPWCATVHYLGDRGIDPDTAERIGEIERGVAWTMIQMEEERGRQ